MEDDASGGLDEPRRGPVVPELLGLGAGGMALATYIEIGGAGLVPSLRGRVEQETRLSLQPFADNPRALLTVAGPRLQERRSWQLHRSGCRAARMSLAA